jgi:long-chain acyl-CoA synthetase
MNDVLSTALVSPDIATLLREAVTASPASPFVTDLRTGQIRTYLDVWRCAEHHAALLRRHGVSPGDRVVFLTKNDPVFFPLLFACSMTGSILVPVNRDNVQAEIDAIMEDAKPAAVVHDEHWRPRTAASVPLGWRTEEAEPLSPLSGSASTHILIIYTSGTTGNAKGVLLSHRNLLRMAKTFVGFYHLRQSQRFLCMLPFYHINAPMITGLVCIAARAHVHLTDPYGAGNARSVFEMVEANRINVLSITPAIMASLMQLNPQGAGRDTSSLEFCFCGTAPLGEKLWREFESRFGVPVYQGYGLTETTTWATMTPPDGRKRYDTVGIPVGCEVRIDGAPTGEVLIKGDIVMSGYYNKKKLTRKSLRDDWYYSGDIGRFDSDHQLVIVGRTKNIIKRRGVLIHPEMIDESLRRSGLLLDTCTVGIPDSLNDERVVTAYVAAQASTDDVRSWLAGHLSSYMQPDEIVAVHAVPRSPVGKPLLRKVRDMVSGELAERAIQTFNRYKVSRAPSDRLPEIRSIIQTAILSGGVITFAGFWGVGRRTEIADADHQAIARLSEIRFDMNAVLEQAQVRILLLLADVHGRCNRVPDEHIGRYFAQIDKIAAAAKLETCRTSEFWREAGLSEGDVGKLAASSRTIDAWQAFALREEFLRQAERRCGTADKAEEYAFRYYCTCLAERPVLTEALKGMIFFTYNDPKFRPIMPELPTVYWHSIKPGTTAKPWFL